MFRVMTNPETGERIIRPILVGSIKNTYLRRTAIVAAFPFTLVATWVFNYIMLTGFVMGAQIGFAGRFVKLTFRHLAMIFQAPWHSEVWNRPRTNKDEWMN